MRPQHLDHKMNWLADLITAANLFLATAVVANQNLFHGPNRDREEDPSVFESLQTVACQ